MNNQNNNMQQNHILPNCFYDQNSGWSKFVVGCGIVGAFCGIIVTGDQLLKRTDGFVSGLLDKK